MQALLVSSGEKGRAILTELMRGAGPFDFTVAGSGSEARRLSAEMEYDLIVINAPLSDEYGDGLSGAEDGHGGASPHDGAQEREPPAAKEDR